MEGWLLRIGVWRCCGGFAGVKRDRARWRMRGVWRRGEVGDGIAYRVRRGGGWDGGGVLLRIGVCEGGAVDLRAVT